MTAVPEKKQRFDRVTDAALVTPGGKFKSPAM